MELVFATNNLNKIREVQNLIPNTIKILSLADIGCLEEIPETQPTIEGNARQKADYISNKYGLDCFADDTGLLVDHLNGAPGVYSARYAGSRRNADDNMDKLLKKLEGIDTRSAHFKTVIALNLNGDNQLFTGICEGTIAFERRGKGGFGYDPIFLPDGYSETFAEMSLDDKNKIGHRGRAIRILVDFLKNY